jgi:hypothetical protein
MFVFDPAHKIVSIGLHPIGLVVNEIRFMVRGMSNVLKMKRHT